MTSNRKTHRSSGQPNTAPRRRIRPPPAGGPAQACGGQEASGVTSSTPDPVIEQAKRDLDAGQVDTDMRATPGLDAKRRATLVPGPGGKPRESGT